LRCPALMEQYMEYASEGADANTVGCGECPNTVVVAK